MMPCDGEDEVPPSSTASILCNRQVLLRCTRSLNIKSDMELHYRHGSADAAVPP